MIEYRIEEAIARYREYYEFKPARESAGIEDVRSAIEHTNLKPFATPDDIKNSVLKQGKIVSMESV